jgi:hypothetical protein
MSLLTRARTQREPLAVPDPSTTVDDVGVRRARSVEPVASHDEAFERGSTSPSSLYRGGSPAGLKDAGLMKAKGIRGVQDRADAALQRGCLGLEAPKMKLSGGQAPVLLASGTKAKFHHCCCDGHEENGKLKSMMHGLRKGTLGLHLRICLKTSQGTIR